MDGYVNAVEDRLAEVASLGRDIAVNIIPQQPDPLTVAAFASTPTATAAPATPAAADVRLDAYTITRLADAIASRPTVVTVDGRKIAAVVSDRLERQPGMRVR
jgi:hypothetical protein